METIKFILFSVVVLALLGLGLFWAVTTIESGTEHASTVKIAELQKENDDLNKQVKALSDELSVSQNTPAPTASSSTPAPATSTPSTTKPPTTNTTVYKNQTLINAISQLITDKVAMKLHSSGTRVGTVQTFLNLYNKTSLKVDNDYGASTVKAVAAFQKDQGLTADGNAGSSTFAKMVDWLKKQG